jgi:hypothetical protein
MNLYKYFCLIFFMFNHICIYIYVYNSKYIVLLKLKKIMNFFHIKVE